MKQCPNCGTENKDHAQFCINCGHKFKPTQNFRRSRSEAPTEPQINENRQQYQAQQRPVRPPRTAYANNYFTDYFNWFKGTLIHPLDQYSDNPYFGITSFGITVLLLWIAEFLSTTNGKIFNEITNLFGFIPVNSYYSILAKPAFKKPLWLLIITLLTIATYWIVDYGYDLFTGHARTNVLFVANHLAGLTNLTTIASVLVIVGALMDSAVIVWLFTFTVKLIFITGLFYAVESSVKGKNHFHFSKLYVATSACLASYVIQGFILILIGNLFMN